MSRHDALQRARSALAEVATRLLADDAVMEMPPVPLWYRGSRDDGRFLGRVFRTRGTGWRMRELTANGQPALAGYAPEPIGGTAAVVRHRRSYRAQRRVRRSTCLRRRRAAAGVRRRPAPPAMSRGGAAGTYWGTLNRRAAMFRSSVCSAIHCPATRVHPRVAGAGRIGVIRTVSFQRGTRWRPPGASLDASRIADHLVWTAMAARRCLSVVVAIKMARPIGSGPLSRFRHEQAGPLLSSGFSGRPRRSSALMAARTRAGASAGLVSSGYSHERRFRTPPGPRAELQAHR
jgi:hypothetical protein